MMKKTTFLSLLLCGAMLAVSVMPAWAIWVYPAVASTDVQLVINGETIATDTAKGAPYISVEGRTMVPLRVIGEALGYDVQYSAGEITLTDATQDVTAVFAAGDVAFTVNDACYEMDRPVFLSPEGRAYVSLRTLMTLFGTVEWDGASRTVYVEMA